jgi:hypothetical protein
MTTTLLRFWAAARAIAALVGVGAASLALRAAEPTPAGESVIQLPPLEVVASAKAGRPWLFAAYPGHEVLSRCSPGVTREFLQAHFRIEQLIALILPRDLQPRRSVPDVLILTPPSQNSTLAQGIFAGALDATD